MSLWKGPVLPCTLSPFHHRWTEAAVGAEHATCMPGARAGGRRPRGSHRGNCKCQGQGPAYLILRAGLPPHPHLINGPKEVLQAGKHVKGCSSDFVFKRSGVEGHTGGSDVEGHTVDHHCGGRTVHPHVGRRRMASGQSRKQSGSRRAEAL